MIVAVEDSLSRELLQNSGCGMGDSATTLLVKFLVSARSEPLLQHGWEHTWHTQPLAFDAAGWLQEH